MKMFEKIKIFAREAHENVNHMYGDKPYWFHIEMAINVGLEFIHLIPEEDREDVLCAIALHDTIEDCRLTHNDIMKVSNRRVADIVYAVSNEKGKTRAERANKKYYKEMLIVKYARFVKLCDRKANVDNSIKEGSRMFAVYNNECFSFISKLFPDGKPIKYFQSSIAVKLINAILKLFTKKIPVMEYDKQLVDKLVYTFPADNYELLHYNWQIQES